MGTVENKEFPFSNSYLFSELEESARAKLSAMIHTKRYASGEVVFREGDPGDSMLVVMRGHVRILTTADDGKGIILAMLGPGEVIGEIALLSGGERSAEAISEGAVELAVLSKRDLIPYLERNPKICIRLLRILALRLRDTSETLKDRTFLSLEARFAKSILKLSDAFGRETENGIRIELKLSQKNLGEMLGVSRESINKQLQAWSGQGIARFNRGYIEIMQRNALAALVSVR